MQLTEKQYITAMKLSDTLGERLRNLRKDKKWTQKHVAGLLDMSVPAISKIESGDTDINYSRLQQMAHVYELTTVELLEGGRRQAPYSVAEVQAANKKLIEYDNTVILLQNKIIYLYEQMQQVARIREEPTRRLV
jgi:transcriptional regulator with XRE-family HTH domain